jgi:lambda repressor-like predicted transcriptional regulator
MSLIIYPLIIIPFDEITIYFIIAYRLKYRISTDLQTRFMSYMATHQGKTIEKVIRRNGYSVSKIARAVGVNRRSVYNWFNQPYLKADLIVPAMLLHLGLNTEDYDDFHERSDYQITNIPDWKNKYIELLERYNELLLQVVSPIKHIHKN